MLLMALPKIQYDTRWVITGCLTIITGCLTVITGCLTVITGCLTAYHWNATISNTLCPPEILKLLNTDTTFKFLSVFWKLLYITRRIIYIFHMKYGHQSLSKIRCSSFTFRFVLFDRFERYRKDIGKKVVYTLSTWDFAGQEEFYSTHQCYLSNRALYLVHTMKTITYLFYFR
jgi:hypothetical protein